MHRSAGHGKWINQKRRHNIQFLIRQWQRRSPSRPVSLIYANLINWRSATVSRAPTALRRRSQIECARRNPGDRPGPERPTSATDIDRWRCLALGANSRNMKIWRPPSVCCATQSFPRRIPSGLWEFKTLLLARRCCPAGSIGPYVFRVPYPVCWPTPSFTATGNLWGGRSSVYRFCDRVRSHFPE